MNQQHVRTIAMVVDHRHVRLLLHPPLIRARFWRQYLRTRPYTITGYCRTPSIESGAYPRGLGLAVPSPNTPT